MSIGAVGGYPDYTMTGSQHIPELFSTKTLVKFYTKTVFAAICNTDYEGEIKKQGDKVIIRTIPDINVNDYVKGQDIVYQTPNSDSVELVIDKAKYWAIKMDQIDEKQADISWMPKYSEDASRQMTKKIDKSILAAAPADVSASNAGATAGAITSGFNLGATGSPITLTKANVLEYIVDCGTVLDEADVPEEDRWMVIPNWMAGLILKSDLKEVSVSGDQTSMMRNGRIGMIDTFTLYKSNQVATVTDGADTVSQILFGNKYGLSFASQITDTAGPFPLERTIGSGMRGLNVYGFDVLKEQAVGMLYAKKG